MKHLIMMGFLFVGFSLVAQNSVKGIVKDEKGEPIPGVNILEKDTKNSTASDLNGNYLIKVGKKATLVFRCVGFKAQEIIVNGAQEISVKLLEDTTQLEEVTIGYGSVKKDKITGSISTIKGEDIAKITASNAAEALQGKAAGVQVLSSGGNPGASPQILIRGITTNNINSEPLIVLDDVMLPDGTSLNLLNPADIENIQVLKDASSLAIYGSRGSRGVILITSKRGKAGKMNINVDLSYGSQRLQKIKMAGAEEYLKVMNLRRTNDGPNIPLFSTKGYTGNTDWWNQVIENYAPMANANISASGGSEKITYAASISFFDQQSNYLKGWYEKVTGRFNVDFKISERVKLKQDLNPRTERYENTPGALYNLLRIDPLTDVYLPQNERAGRNIYSIYKPSLNNVPNPVAGIARQFNETFFFGLLSNTQLEYKITPELTFNSQLGLNITNSRTDAFDPQYFINVNQQREINKVYRNTNQNFDYVWNNTINFKKTTT
jgi:TonB-dependent starch-binding outer membrane protein SusC